MSNLDAQIRAKVAHPPTVTSEGYGATEVNWWAAHASDALLAALDSLMLLKHELPETDLTPWEKGVVDQARMVQKAIAEKLGIEVDRG